MTVGALARFVARRLAMLAVLLGLISMVVFGLLYLAPGSVEQVLLGDAPVTPQAIQAVRQQYHLDEPLHVQYAIWLRGAVQLDFGRSIRSKEPVLTAIGGRLPVTLFIVTYGFVVALVSGLALGILAAMKRGRAADRAVVALSVIGVSTPAFVSGLLLMYAFGILVPVFPVFGQGEGFLDQLWHLTLPAVALALTGMAMIIKLTRAAMISALEQDYVAFARARGVPEWRVLFAYGLRNSLNPIVTAAGLIFNRLLFGTVLVEVTFALAGIGSLLVESVNFKDVPLVQGVAMLVALLVVLVSLVVDVLYLLIDPRVRFSQVAA